jgi:hypothetical protein
MEVNSGRWLKHRPVEQTIRSAMKTIAAKFNTLTDGVAARGRIGKLQDFLLNIEKQENSVAVLDLLEAEVANVLA